MIRIVRPAAHAGQLPGGQALIDAIAAERHADPLAGGSRQRAFQFLKRVYGPAAVKRALRRTQFDKCCYCESYFLNTSHGDVEHFRPKTCVQQDYGEPTHYPGYYWLAYRWENLLFACDQCNRSAKKIFFPLANPLDRLTSADDPPEREQPLLIDPGAEDPRDHIRFDWTTPRPLTERGAITIRILKLDRGGLLRPRLSHLKHIEALLELTRLDNRPANAEKRQRAAQALAEAVEPSAIFTSMTRDYLEKEGWPPAGA